MAGHAKRRRLERFLARHAEAALGKGAGAIDYVCAEIATGKTLVELTREVAWVFGEDMTPQWFYRVIRWLGPQAEAQYEAARVSGRLARGVRREARRRGADYTPPDRLDRLEMERDATLRRWERLGGHAGRAHLDALRAVQPAARPVTMDDLRVRSPQ